MGTPPSSGGPKKPHVLRRGEAAASTDKSKRVETRTTEIDTRELAALIDGQASTGAPPQDLDAVIEVVEAKGPSRPDGVDDSKPVRAVLARGNNGVVVRAARPLPAPPAKVPEGSGAMQPTPPDGVAAQKRQRTAPAPVVIVESAPIAIEDDPYKHIRPTTESEPLRHETEAEPEPARSSGRLYVLLATLLLAASAAALLYAMR